MRLKCKRKFKRIKYRKINILKIFQSLAFGVKSKEPWDKKNCHLLLSAINYHYRTSSHIPLSCPSTYLLSEVRQCSERERLLHEGSEECEAAAVLGGGHSRVWKHTLEAQLRVEKLRRIERWIVHFIRVALADEKSSGRWWDRGGDWESKTSLKEM